MRVKYETEDEYTIHDGGNTHGNTDGATADYVMIGTWRVLMGCRKI